MDKCQHMKAFVSNAIHYLRFQNDGKISLLQRHLQVLSVTTDITVFEPNNGISVEFYTCLHELMTSLEPSCPLVWSAVTVLQQACKNKSARAALTNTFKFVPVLAKILGNNLTREKKVNVLKLLQDVTYGAVIPWQEAHLTKLVSILSSWIINEKNTVGTLSLGVLVNLCYKNVPAIYTLLRCVDHKSFLKTLLELKTENIYTTVQVLKLLTECDSVSGGIPDGDILYFVTVAFMSIKEVLRTRDTFLLRLILDFFADVNSSTHTRQVLLSYASFKDGVEKLLDQHCQSDPPEELGMLLEFLQTLILIRIEDLMPLYSRILQLALCSIPCSAVAAPALSLAQAILSTSTNTSGESGSLIGQFSGSLSTLLTVFCDENGTSDVQQQLCELMRDMCDVAQLREKLLQVLDVELVQQQIRPLVTPEDRPHYYYDDRVTKTVLSVLELTVRLAQFDGRWLTAASGMLEPTSVHMILALALSAASEDIRRRIFNLVASPAFTRDCLSQLAKSLCRIQPVTSGLSLGSSGLNGGGDVYNISTNTFFNTLPPYNLERQSRLDDLMNKLEAAAMRKEVGNMTTAVMELYGHKVAMLAQSERTLQMSLTAASSHCTQLQHQVMQARAEASCLHQLLYSSQQCCEGLEQEKRLLAQKLEEEKSTAASAHAQHVQDFKEKQRVILGLTNSVEELKAKLSMKEKDLEASKQKIDEQLKKINNLNKEIADKIAEMKNLEKEATAKHADYAQTLTKMENRIEKRDRVIHELQGENEKKNKKIEALQLESQNLEEVCRAQEKTLQQKDAEMEVLQRQLTELQRIRDMIYNISAGNMRPEV
ncbi:uncharacterized protein LOC126285386 [Schistocerca gregaria]|uniref:uncharacterized protein LOC126285386 n=1 Tax=Schistocerca gregaria TaxID=7010 RepID=UPI00211F1908|nr:uncharacterized protein LOC126285386 [Schistocerca gregaria]